MTCGGHLISCLWWSGFLATRYTGTWLYMNVVELCGQLERLLNNKSANIGACMPGHIWALSGLFRIMRTHNTRTRREETWSPAYSICVHRRTYSVQCSDKIRFPQLHMKCGIAKSCPGTHKALQVPMSANMSFSSEEIYIATTEVANLELL